MKRRKLFIIVFIAIILSFSIATLSYGFELRELTGEQSLEVTIPLKQAGNNIVGVITAIGIVISVVMLIVLGIKYMIGSIEEKAEYKKTLLPYMIGAGLLFLASGIAQLIYSLAIQLKI